MKSFVEGENRTSAKSLTDKKSVVTEVRRVRGAIQDGNLSERASLVGVHTESRMLLFQINEMLDSVTKPIHLVAKYIDDLSKGLIPPAIADDYKGEYKTLADNLNAVVTIMISLRDVAELEIVRRIFETRETLTFKKRVQNASTSIAKAFNRIIASMF